MSGATFLAVEIGGTKLQVVAGTDNGRIIERQRFAIIAREGAAGIQRTLDQVIPPLTQKYTSKAMGVGYGGPVDWRKGEVIHSHQIAGWDGFPLAYWLQGLCQCPVFIDNDANVAALAETRFGAGRGKDPVFYATIGSGVGGGLTVDGNIYHGAFPGEVEFGHLRLDATGRTVEDACSGWNVDRQIRAAAATQPESALAKLTASDPGRGTRHLGAALAAGDALGQHILKEWAGNLAFGLSHVVHLFHPEIIVLGGGASLLGEPLRAAIAQELPRLVMEVFQPGPPVMLSECGEDVVPIGALALAVGEWRKINKSRR